MPTYKLSPLAELDYFEILDYTLEKWGIQQFEKYRDVLKGTILRLAQSPTLGKRCEDIHPDLYRYGAGHHIIFYRIAGEGIEIARILHERMDVPRHFPYSGDD